MRFSSASIIALAAICASWNAGVTVAAVAEAKQRAGDAEQQQYVRRAQGQGQGAPKNRKTRTIHGVSVTTDEDDSPAYGGHYLFTSDTGNGKNACKKLKAKTGVTDCEWYDNVKVGSFAVPDYEGGGNGAKEQKFLEKALSKQGALSGLVDKIDSDTEVFASEIKTDATSLWGLDFTDGNDDSMYTYKVIPNASKIYIAIMDTGVRCSHQEFQENGLTCDNSLSFVGGDGNDRNGHGTHCAGTAIGGTVGVAQGLQGANLLSYKVLGDSGSGSTAGIVVALENLLATAAANPDNYYIASMSLGGGFSSSLNNAVNNLAARSNAQVVVAAGNSNRNACNYSPASASGAITVGSITESTTRSSFSNYGTCVDIFAPGSSIKSSYWTSDTAYATLQGTSMACPHVAGAVAVLQAAGLDLDVLYRENCGIPSLPSGTPDICLTTEASLTDTTTTTTVAGPTTTTTEGPTTTTTSGPTTTTTTTTTTTAPPSSSMLLTSPSSGPYYRRKGYFFDLTAGTSTVGITSITFQSVDAGYFSAFTKSPDSVSDRSTFAMENDPFQWQTLISNTYIPGGATVTLTFGAPFIIPAGEARPFHLYSTGRIKGHEILGSADYWLASTPVKYPDYVSDDYLTLSESFVVPRLFGNRVYYHGGINANGLEIEYVVNPDSGILAESASWDATLEIVDTADPAAVALSDAGGEDEVTVLKPKNARCEESYECVTGYCHSNDKCK